MLNNWEEVTKFEKNLPSVLTFTQYRQKEFFHILVILSENLNIILKPKKPFWTSTSEKYGILQTNIYIDL